MHNVLKTANFKNVETFQNLIMAKQTQKNYLQDSMKRV